MIDYSKQDTEGRREGTKNKKIFSVFQFVQFFSPCMVLVNNVFKHIS